MIVYFLYKYETSEDPIMFNEKTKKLNKKKPTHLGYAFNLTMEPVNLRCMQGDFWTTLG